MVQMRVTVCLIIFYYYSSRSFLLYGPMSLVYKYKMSCGEAHIGYTITRNISRRLFSAERAAGPFLLGSVDHPLHIQNTLNNLTPMSVYEQ